MKNFRRRKNPPSFVQAAASSGYENATVKKSVFEVKDEEPEEENPESSCGFGIDSIGLGCDDIGNFAGTWDHEFFVSTLDKEVAANTKAKALPGEQAVKGNSVKAGNGEAAAIFDAEGNSELCKEAAAEMEKLLTLQAADKEAKQAAAAAAAAAEEVEQQYRMRASNLLKYSKSKNVEAYAETMDCFIDGTGKPINYEERIRTLTFSKVIDNISKNQLEDAQQDIFLLDPEEDEKKKNFLEKGSNEGEKYKYLFRRYLDALKQENVSLGGDDRSKMEKALAQLQSFSILDKRGKGAIPEKLLHRLHDSFHNCGDSNLNVMWFDGFKRALAMMGKCMDEKGLESFYIEALHEQTVVDKHMEKYLHSRFTEDPQLQEYVPHSRFYPDQNIVQMIMQKTVKARVIPPTPIEEDESCCGFGNLKVEPNLLPAQQDEDEEEIEIDAGKARADSCQNISLAWAQGDHTFVEKTETLSNIKDLKDLITEEHGIPVQHLKILDPESKEELRDNVKIDDRTMFKVARGLMKCVWVQFFVDKMTQDVDEDLVLEHWKNICTATRMSRDGDMKKPGRFDPKQDPSEMFCYAEDMRRVLTGFGQKMSDEDADIFIKECQPVTTRQLHARGEMAYEIYSLPENKNDLLPRVYHKQYYDALTDDTL